MNYIITGVQITSIIVMGMASLSFSFLFPHRITIGEVYNRSRHCLILGTFLAALHFAIQLHLQVNYTHIEDMRTVVNLLIGMPCCFLFNISNLNLIRKGRIKKKEYAVFFISYLLVVFLFGFHYFHGKHYFDIDMLTPVMAAIFGINLLFYVYLILRDYHSVYKASQQEECDPALLLLLHWTKWMTLFLAIIGFGFPIMAFHTNLTIRGLYGILTIGSSYYYMSCFIGYGVYMQNKKMTLEHYTADKFAINKIEESLPACPSEEADIPAASTALATTDQAEAEETTRTEDADPLTSSPAPNDKWKKQRKENVEVIVNNFLKTDFYLQPGIKLKDVANQMGISVPLLRAWLRTTPYEKFNNWLLSLRIEHAKELMLSNPDFSSDEIALQCGFCDRQYFQIQFKKQIGISPTDWLKVKKPH